MSADDGSTYCGKRSRRNEPICSASQPLWPASANCVDFPASVGSFKHDQFSHICLPSYSALPSTAEQVLRQPQHPPEPLRLLDEPVEPLKIAADHPLWSALDRARERCRASRRGRS